MSEVRLEVQLEGAATEFRASEQLRAWVRVHAPVPVSAVELECRVLFFTEGKGTEDVGGTLPVTLATKRLIQPGEVFPFETRLPSGPWTYDGQLVKIRWVVQAVLRRHRASEVDAEVGFRLLPGVMSAPRASAAGK